MSCLIAGSAPVASGPRRRTPCKHAAVMCGFCAPPFPLPHLSVCDPPVAIRAGELVNCRDELLQMLVQAAYDIAGDIAAHNATSKATGICTRYFRSDVMSDRGERARARAGPMLSNQVSV
jgi:hypothetical protein